jgi:hypothetical protein
MRRLAEEKEKLHASMKAAGFFRFEVRPQA